MLAAEDGAGLGHHLLDERVADPGAHGRAAVLATTSGTAFEQMRLWRIVAPGLVVEHAGRRRSPWSSEPRQALALLVDEEHAVGVAVERQTEVGAGLEHPRLRSRWFSGWIGSAGWFGNVPSSSGYMISMSNGRPSKTSGTTRPPIPLAMSATTFSGLRTDVDERPHVGCVVGQEVEPRDRAGACRRVGNGFSAGP